MNYSGFNDFTGDQAKMFIDTLSKSIRDEKQNYFRQEGFTG